MLEVKQLTVRYGVGVEALSDVALTALPATATAVIGGNGAGKSTIMRAIAGVLGFHKGTVATGNILFEGRDITRLAPNALVKLGIVHVPEGRRIFADMTVLDNLRAGAAQVRGFRARQAKLAEILDLFPILNERRNQRGALLSGGEQQILAIARGLMSSPKVMLLDEPTLGLSPQMVERVAQTIERVTEQGLTVLIAEQNAAMALRVATYGNVVERGRIVLSDRTDALRSSPDVQALFLGGGEAAPDISQTRTLRRLEKWVA